MTISVNMGGSSITVTTVNVNGEAIVGFTIYDNQDGSMVIYTGACIDCNVQDGLKILHLTKEDKWEKPGD